MTALAGLVIAALLWWGLKAFSRAQPSHVAQLLRYSGGVAALGVAALLLLRGRIDMAALAGGAAAWLFGWSAIPPRWLPSGWLPGGARGPRAGTSSKVRSASIEMELDHGSGTITGRVLAGRHAGRGLAELALPSLLDLRAECLAGDVEGGRLVEAYLDRRFPAWREDAEGDAHGRSGPDLQHGPMAEQEAYEILGLEPGAGPDDVRAAHRRLMKALHPDQGGSTYLASRVNQAKDILLDRHR